MDPTDVDGEGDNTNEGSVWDVRVFCQSWVCQDFVGSPVTARRLRVTFWALLDAPPVIEPKYMSVYFQAAN
jgi:hypothetical protein